MKWIIASDIHGSAKYAELLLEVYEKEKCKLLLLGDLLYHGPRNDLPEEYNPKRVISLLNEIADDIVCVRGNCEAEVDQMVLNFPLMADYIVLENGGKLFFATHGHIYNEKKPLHVGEGNILLCGHTHVPACIKSEYVDASGKSVNFYYVNPGSVSIPKENSPHSYMLLQDGAFVWKDLVSGKEFTVGNNK